ncbi:MAG: permease-like cell division protein FtsX [Candidatus Eisenbacteria bacterium]
MQQFRFFLSESWEYLLRGRGTSLASVVALSAVLFLFALVLLVSHNVVNWSSRLSAREGLTVFLAEGVSEARAHELEQLFRGFGEVESVRFVSRDQALQELEQDLGGLSVEDALGENPLPHSLVITLTPTAAGQAGSTQRLAAEVRNYDDIDDVVFGDEWVGALEQGLRRLHLANLAVGMLSALAVGVVLYTTLKLVFFGRRETVRILKVVGATNRFIRSPFLMLGGLQCLLSGVLALVLLGLARVALSSWLPGFDFLPWSEIALFLLAAMLFGVIAAFIAIEPALHGLEKEHEEVVR